MKKTFLLALILIAAPAFTQEVQNAPMVAQCQADQRLWFHRMKDKDDPLADTSFRMLLHLEAEMQNCRRVDSPNEPLYNFVVSEILRVKDNRAFAFIDRHKLLDLFLTEDEAAVMGPR
jgi:hypothetical protein